MHNNETPADKEVCDFDKETWLKVYEKLFGGFDDLCEEEEESEEDNEGGDSSYPGAGNW